MANKQEKPGSATKKAVKTAAKIAWVVPAVIASIETPRAEDPEAPKVTP